MTEGDTRAQSDQWKKQVKIHPPHVVSFKESQEENKFHSQIEVTNNS